MMMFDRWFWWFWCFWCFWWFFYFILTLPPNSSQAKNYVRSNPYSEYASKLSINASKLSTSGSEAHHKRSWSSEMMAEHPLGVFGLVNPMAERSLRVLTYRLDLRDMGDMGDVRMAIFHFFRRQKMYFEKGFILKKLVIPEDGGAPVGCFRPLMSLSIKVFRNFNCVELCPSSSGQIYGSYDSSSPLERGSVHAKDNRLPINCGAVLFTTKVVVNLLVVVRETTP